MDLNGIYLIILLVGFFVVTLLQACWSELKSIHRLLRDVVDAEEKED